MTYQCARSQHDDCWQELACECSCHETLDDMLADMLKGSE